MLASGVGLLQMTAASLFSAETGKKLSKTIEGMLNG